MNLAIIIPSYNSNNSLSKLIEIINQDYSMNIIAVDDGSTDSSLERLKKFENTDDESGKSVMILSQSARGLSAARQLAVDNAKGEWVAITDIDVRPEIDWITKLVERVLHNNDENIGAVTGRTIFETTPNVVSKLRSVEIQQKYKNIHKFKKYLYFLLRRLRR